MIYAERLSPFPPPFPNFPIVLQISPAATATIRLLRTSAAKSAPSLHALAVP